MRTVLSPSSLNTVKIEGCEYPLDGIETISNSISSLTFLFQEEDIFILNIIWHMSRLIPSFSRVISSLNPLWVKGGTKLSHVLRENTSLKTLELHIPLDKDEVQDILDSLKDNHSLERLELCEEYHSQYFSESEKQALDPRVIYRH